MPDAPTLVLIVAVVSFLVFSLGVHEAAHGWVALKCGDPTARDLGRITINPIAHIDLFQTILLPIILYSVARVFFGGAKPVPVAFHRLRNPWRDMSLVALAGPASNFLLAIGFFFVYRIVVEFAGFQPVRSVWQDDAQVLPLALMWAVEVNLLLAAFNLLPIPPLDGSRVMAWILPESLRPAYLAVERFGILVVILLVFYFPPIRSLLGSAMDAMLDAVVWIVSLGGLW